MYMYTNNNNVYCNHLPSLSCPTLYPLAAVSWLLPSTKELVMIIQEVLAEMPSVRTIMAHSWHSV